MEPSSSGATSSPSDDHLPLSSPPPLPPPRPSLSRRIRHALTSYPSPEARDDALSCFAVVLTLWFLGLSPPLVCVCVCVCVEHPLLFAKLLRFGGRAASITLILGIYGSVDLLVGPNCSRLLHVSSFFVQDIKVKADKGSQIMLYGFQEPPLLNVPANWVESHNVSLPVNFHKDWVYYLNKGAQIKIIYGMESEGSYPLNLIVAQGKEDFVQWIENPSQPNTALSWSLVNGTGVVELNTEKSSDYYVAVGNLNNLETKVQLEFRIHMFLYNTTGAHYKCSLDHGLCVLKLPFFRSNAAVLSSGPVKGEKSDELYVRLSYGPRWLTYFVGSALVTVAILLFYKMLQNLLLGHEDGAGHQSADTTNERSPLLANKEEDDSSLGSSYESVSHDEEDMDEEWLRVAATRSLEGEPSCLCAVCCDAQRDCFFLPCGHCATCYSCGTRISNEAGTCPICRRRMKKVRRIFAV